MGYVSVISMFLGFFAWYAGLARGGVARIGRLQLAQPVLTLGWPALLLREHLTLAAGLAATAVLASVVVGRNARVERTPSTLGEPSPPRAPRESAPTAVVAAQDSHDGTLTYRPEPPTASPSGEDADPSE